MLILVTLASWAPLVQGTLEYSGRDQGDPRLEALAPEVQRAIERVGEAIPEWLTDEPPCLTPRLVDLEAPPVSDTWPRAIFQGYFKVDSSGCDPVALFDLPVDPLLAHPSRCRAALLRQLLFGITTTQVGTHGLALGRIRDFGMGNPVLYALGSHLAGELEEEPPMSPMAREVLLRLARLEEECGNIDAAREALECLRSEYSWVQGCWERSEVELQHLDTDD